MKIWKTADTSHHQIRDMGLVGWCQISSSSLTATAAQSGDEFTFLLHRQKIRLGKLQQCATATTANKQKTTEFSLKKARIFIHSYCCHSILSFSLANLPQCHHQARLCGQPPRWLWPTSFKIHTQQMKITKKNFWCQKNEKYCGGTAQNLTYFCLKHFCVLIGNHAHPVITVISSFCHFVSTDTHFSLPSKTHYHPIHPFPNPFGIGIFKNQKKNSFFARRCFNRQILKCAKLWNFLSPTNVANPFKFKMMMMAHFFAPTFAFKNHFFVMISRKVPEVKWF